jgi:type IV fimbrial biogenesis protein FimT
MAQMRRGIGMDSYHAGAMSMRFRGLTLVELMAVIAVVAVLSSMALPGFAGAIERYRVRRASEDMIATLYAARSEAIRRGGRVTIAKMNPPGCATTQNKDWSCGWVVFADDDGDGVLDAGETPIQFSPPTPGVMATASLPNPANRTRLDRWGRFNDNVGALSFGFSPAETPEAATGAWRVCVNGTRIRSVPGVAACPA